VASVEFGAALSSMKDIAACARLVEGLGYDYLCSGEHMMFHGAVPNSLISLAVAAGATSRIKLMSTVVLLPLYPPMVVAKMTSALDVASEGRYHMGIGVGGEFPKEFEACGRPGHAAWLTLERGARTDQETLDREELELRGPLQQVFRCYARSAAGAKAASAHLGGGPQRIRHAARSAVC